jgi:hypothetical protein
MVCTDISEEHETSIFRAERNIGAYLPSKELPFFGFPQFNV